MTQLIRRTIDEILVRYELEPTLRDIYVEGCFDRDIIARCLGESSERITTVYEIDSVDIPTSLLLKFGLTEGNKQRVIALSKALTQLTNSRSYLCLVDKDLDHWFGPLERARGLVWTEHCDIELYFFTNDLLIDILVVAAKTRIQDFAIFTSSIVEVLRRIYSFRLADRELGWGMSWIPREKHLSAEGNRVEFDDEEFIKRLLISNGRYLFREKFKESVKKWQGCLSGDYRSCIRGHDFIEALIWAIKSFKGNKEFASRTVIQGIFVLHANRLEGLRELLAQSLN